MNTTKLIVAAAMAAATLSTGALAQSPAEVQAPAPQVSPTPNEVIYLPKLPAVADLVSAAAASHGVTIQKIDQTANQITVVYRFDSGQTNTVAYQLIAAGDPNAVPPGATAVVPAPGTPAPTVVYATNPYPDPYYYYAYAPYPGYYWPGWVAPVAFGLGFGFGHGWHGGWGGGWHGGWGGHH